MWIGLLVPVWALFALGGAWVMFRRGHALFTWGALFVALGPLAVPLAIAADRRRNPDPAPSFRPGAMDILAADDGSREAAAALDHALALVGAQATSLTIVAVLDLDAPDTVAGRETEAEARARLAKTAERATSMLGMPADTVVLHGDPVRRISAFASEGGYELVVVGSRGRGASRAVLGSVARRLSSGTQVPVLVGPAVVR